MPEKVVECVGRQKYMTQTEVREIMRRLWDKESDLLQYLYAMDYKIRDPQKKLGLYPPGLQSLIDKTSFKKAYQMFFIQVVAVPPNNVRPLSKMNDMVYENPQNIALTQVSSPVIQ